MPKTRKGEKIMKTMQVLNISKTKIDVAEVPAYTLGISNEHMFAKAVNSLRIKDEKSKIAKALDGLRVSMTLILLLLQRIANALNYLMKYQKVIYMTAKFLILSRLERHYTLQLLIIKTPLAWL